MENIKLALRTAEHKDKLGMLLNSKNKNYDEVVDNWDLSKGDFETVYSIASMFGSENIGGEGTEDQILNELREKYPKHF